MNRLIISFLLLCTVLWPCKAQHTRGLDPGNRPGLNWYVAEITGLNKYLSLTKAFEAINSENQTIELLMGVTQEGELPISYSTTLDLNKLTLTCASGMTLKITKDKTLILSDGNVSGSLQLTGEGRLFAGEDVKMASLGVMGGSPSKNLYRILVKLPDGTGKLENVAYGTTSVSFYARQSNILCCWLPQNVTALPIAYTYTPLGSTQSNYATASLSVMQHAENSIPSVKGTETGGNVAKVKEGNSYTSLEAAFTAIQSTGGEIELLGNTSLSGVVQPSKNITLDLAGWSLATTGSASFEPNSSSCVHIKKGSLSGTFSINGDVTADQTVSLTAAVTRKTGGTQVYRTRLLLPENITGKILKYTYGSDINQTVTPILEDGNNVAYLWLSAHVATPFVLTLEETSKDKEIKTKNNVTIQANHDNGIDLRKGDAEAILYKNGETPGIDPGIPYGTFHEALNEAGKLDGSQVWLQRNVSFSGDRDHDHTISGNVITELHLNGYTMSATNCTLDASASGACLRICDADKGIGSITGTFRIKGNVYIGKDVNAGKIGTVLDESGQNLYRVLVRVETKKVLPSKGVISYALGISAEKACYLSDKESCIWLPLQTASSTLTLSIEGNTYASAVNPTASHSNTVTVREPAIVAAIQNGAEYTTLQEAFEKARDGDKIILQQNTSLASVVNIADKKLTLDLDKYTLTMNSGSGFEPSGTGTLLVQSNSEQGVLSGNFSVTEQVCVNSSVSISGLVSIGVKIVQRTTLYLPKNYTSGSWSYSTQYGTLLFDGQTATGQPIAYAWIEVENGSHDLATVLKGTPDLTKTLTSVLIQATHNNRFNMESEGKVAEVDGLYYGSFELALKAVNTAQKDGIITLWGDQTLRGLQSVEQNVVIEMNGKTLSMTADASFVVSDSKTLRIADTNANISVADKGFLYGTLLIKGAVYVDPDIKLSGTVVRNGEEVCRLLVDGLPEETDLTACTYTLLTGKPSQKALWLNHTACLWIPTGTAEDELQFTHNGETYETSLLPSLSGHINRVQAYRRVEVTMPSAWADNTNKDCNVVLAPGVTLTIEENGPSTLHRLTMGNGSQVITNKAVLATAGIIYRRSFETAKRWEGFSLPFEARRATAVIKNKVVDLSPYLVSGTGGHYWLQVLTGDDSFRYVAEESLKANKGYVISVPQGLTTADQASQGGGIGMAISFISPANQYLNRTALEPVPPVGKGFRQCITGALKNIPVDRPFYLLNNEGTEYVRQVAGTEVPPFSSYLLADEQTTATTASLRFSGLPLSNEHTAIPKPASCQVTGGRLCIRLNATEEQWIQVVTLSGQLKYATRIPAGETVLTLPAGLYVVNRQKVFVTE